MKIPQLQGLKFPDDYVVKFFFKKELHCRKGNALELGCGNGNNLLLFYEFGWNVVGLDINEKSLAAAESNFRLAGSNGPEAEFVLHDLIHGLSGKIAKKFDVILLPNVLYYIPRRAAINVLQKLRTHAAPEAFVFLRARTQRDYRYGRGDEVERNGYRLTESATGEHGLLNVFYSEWELVDMLREFLYLDMQTAEVLTVDYQNPQQGVRVNNSDIVIWGRMKPSINE